MQHWASHAIAKATDSEVTDRDHRFGTGDDEEQQSEAEGDDDDDGTLEEGAPSAADGAARSTRMDDTARPARALSLSLTKGGNKELV